MKALADPGATRPISDLGGPKCSLVPLSEMNLMIMPHYVNLVSLYHVGIGWFGPLPL